MWFLHKEQDYPTLCSARLHHRCRPKPNHLRDDSSRHNYFITHTQNSVKYPRSQAPCPRCQQVRSMFPAMNVTAPRSLLITQHVCEVTPPLHCNLMYGNYSDSGSDSGTSVIEPFGHLEVSSQQGGDYASHSDLCHCCFR